MGGLFLKKRAQWVVVTRVLFGCVVFVSCSQKEERAVADNVVVATARQASNLGPCGDTFGLQPSPWPMRGVLSISSSALPT